MADDKALEPDAQNTGNQGAKNPQALEGISEEILEAMPEEVREKVLQSGLVHRAEFFQGPLPPPTILKGYEEVLPGSADRILKLTEQQRQHQIEMERAIVHSDIWMERLGLAAGFILALILAIGGIWLSAQGKQLTGLAVLTGEMAILVGAFYFAQKKRQSGSEAHQEMPRPPKPPSQQP